MSPSESWSTRVQYNKFRSLIGFNKVNSSIQPTVRLLKSAVPHLPNTFKVTNGLLHRTGSSLSLVKNRMVEDDSVRTLLQSARLSARRVFINVARVLSFIPRNVQTTRSAVHRVATSTVRKTKLQVSDDYIHGALDLLTLTGFLALSAHAILLSTRTYKTAADIPIRHIRRQGILHGSVVAVRDGDNLRIRHTPAFHRLLGWYMKPRGRDIAAETINVRLAAVDAPECGAFGGPGQKYGPRAREWLKRFVGRRVVVRLHATDQYKRVIGTIWAKSDVPVLGSLGFWRQNVGLELVKAGYANVYTGSGAAYGGIRHAYEKAEAVARGRGVGMWAARRVDLPAEYKRLRRAGVVKKGGQRTGDTTSMQTTETGPRALLKALAEMYDYLKKHR